MPTIFDIARTAKVSVMTVSRILNNPDIVSDKTKIKVHKIMDDLGYQPSEIARSLVKKRTNTIGVIMPDIKNTFFNSWFRYIEDYASSHNFNLLLCNTDEEPAKEIKYIKLLQSQRVDGIIITPCSKKSIEYLIKSKVKFICVDRFFEELKTDFVSTDHSFGALQATEYLIRLRHKNIAVLRGSGILYPDIKRYEGFLEAMKKHNLKVNQEHVLNCEFDETSACKRVKELFTGKNPPTAIFSFNSLMMVGAIKTVLAMGKKIPDDISLICYDEIPGYEIFKPKIACVTQPIQRLGNESIKSLIEKIKHQDFSKTKIYLKPTLVVGDSCKRI